MRLKIIQLFIATLIMMLSVQCTKDKIEVNHECIPHEMLTNGYGQPIFKGVYPAKEMAYFNPNNSNEIIYRYADGVTPEFDLIKYNLVTKQQEVIYQGFFSNRPRWGKNGWILLNIQDELGYNVYKIKDNGEDLTALTYGTHCFDPEWNISSDHFIYNLGFTNPTKYIISNSKNEILDTVLIGPESMGSWQHEELIINGTFKGLFIGNISEEMYDLIYETNGVAQSANGAEWLDEERVFWCHTTGIYVTNIVTRETEVIRETCNARCYQRPTYAPDIDKVIVERMERILDSEDSGRTFINLVMMNPDGTEEEVIELE